MPTERNPKLFDVTPVEGGRVVAAFDAARSPRTPVHCCWAKPTGRSV